MTININKTTQEYPTTPVISPAVIERTNQTNPDYVDVLKLHSNFNTINISLSTYQQFGTNTTHSPDFWNSDKVAVTKQSSMELTVDEAVILRNKLNEFLLAHEEFSPYNFMAGVHEHESVEKKNKDWLNFLEEYDIELPGFDEDLPRECPIKYLHPDLQQEYEKQYKEIMEIFNRPRKDKR